MTTRVRQRGEPPERTNQPVVMTRALNVGKLLRAEIQGTCRHALAGRQPADPRVAPEPGFLAAGEADGWRARSRRAPDRWSARRRGSGAAAGSRGRGWRSCRRAGRARPAAAPRPPGPPPTCGRRGTRSSGKLSARQLDADLDRGAARVVAGHRRAERTPGQLDDLEGAHDPATVAWQDGGRRDGVRRGQPRVERRRAGVGQLGLQPLADGRVRAGEVQVAERGPDVEARAADQDRDLAARGDVGDDRVGEVLVLGDAGGLGDVPDVEQVMRHAPPLLDGQLRRADVHAAVELH